MKFTVKPSDIYASHSQVDNLLYSGGYKVVDFRKPLEGDRYIALYWRFNTEELSSNQRIEVRTWNSAHFCDGPRLIVTSKCHDNSYWE